MIEQLTSQNVIWSIVIVIATLIVMAVLGHIQKKIMEKAEAAIRTEALVGTFFRIIKSIIWILVILTVLDVNDVNIRSLLTGVGVAGVVVGLAMQDLIKDAVMGFHIITDKSFALGDRVRIGTEEGIITQFTILSTQYESIDTGDTVTICNREITKVSKLSGSYSADVGIAYDEDPQRVCEVLAGAAEKAAEADIIKSARSVGIVRYEDSAIVYKLLYQCDPVDKWAAGRAVMKEIDAAVRDAGIRVPYPQLEIHMQDAPGPAAE